VQGDGRCGQIDDLDPLPVFVIIAVIHVHVGRIVHDLGDDGLADVLHGQGDRGCVRDRSAFVEVVAELIETAGSDVEPDLIPFQIPTGGDVILIHRVLQASRDRGCARRW